MATKSSVKCAMDGSRLQSYAPQMSSTCLLTIDEQARLDHGNASLTCPSIQTWTYMAYAVPCRVCVLAACTAQTCLLLALSCPSSQHEKSNTNTHKHYTIDDLYSCAMQGENCPAL
jgi:hypothetical protein